jgi:predicted phosphodiesterase
MNKYRSQRSKVQPLRPLVMALICIATVSCFGGYYLADKGVLLDVDGTLILPMGPYQRYIGPGELLIGAQIPKGHKGVATYWKVGEKAKSVKVQFEPAWDRIKYVHLAGLHPEADYVFKISAGNHSTRGYPIVTGVKKDKPFRFLAIGDTKSDCYKVHETLVGHMSHKQASFYIHLGDYVRQGDRFEDWDEFFDIERPLMNRMPILPVVGNHDTSDAALFTGFFLMNQESHFPKRYYKVKFGNVLVISLDTRPTIAVGDAQYLFLQQALELSRSSEIDHVFIALHEPLYSSGRHSSTKKLAESILPLIERYPVTAVLSGHDHHYERSKPINGIVHIVTGGGGAKLTPVVQTSFCEKALETFHFLEFLVDGDHVTLKSINLQGKVIDEVRIK